MSYIGLLCSSKSDVRDTSVSIEADCYIMPALLSTCTKVVELHEQHGPDMSRTVGWSDGLNRWAMAPGKPIILPVGNESQRGIIY